MLKMPAVFSSSMVLQRSKNIAVWGESDSVSVTVSLNGCTVETNVNGVVITSPDKFMDCIAISNAICPFVISDTKLALR